MKSAPVTGRILVVVPVAVLVVVVLVGALVVGGARPQPTTDGLPDAGPLTGWGLPAVQLLERLAAVLTVGTLLLSAVLSPPGLGSARSRVLVAASAWALLWAGAAVVGALLSASALAGVPVADLSPESVVGIVTGFAPGRAAAWTVLSTLVLAAGARLAARSGAPGRHLDRVLLVAAVATILLPVVTAGHATTAGNHLAAVTTIALHVVAATVWVGGLAAVVLYGRTDGSALPRTIARYSTMALVCFVVTALSGALGASVLLGGSDEVLATLGTGYGALLGLKSIALLALGLLGARHRTRTLVHLGAGRPKAFRRLAAVEVVVMLATVALAVGLSAAPAPVDGTPEEAPAAPPAAAQSAPADAPVVPEDMTGHDHGELSVGVLVDADRFHVGATVAPGRPVTVYNGSGTEVSLTADDGSFDLTVPARTLLTFVAPTQPGPYPFTSRHADRFRGVLLVE